MAESNAGSKARVYEKDATGAINIGFNALKKRYRVPGESPKMKGKPTRGK